MWFIGAVLGVFIGASAAFARYRGQWGVYLGSIIAAVVVVWLLSARIPGATGLVFIVSYILTYGVLQFGVLRQMSLRGGGAARGGAAGGSAGRPGAGPQGPNQPNSGGPKSSGRRIIEHKDD